MKTTLTSRPTFSIEPSKSRPLDNRQQPLQNLDTNGVSDKDRDVVFAFPLETDSGKAARFEDAIRRISRPKTSRERGNQLLGANRRMFRAKDRERDFGGTPSVPSPSAYLVGVRGVGVRRPGIPEQADADPVAIDRNPKRFGGKDFFEARLQSPHSSLSLNAERESNAESDSPTHRENRRDLALRVARESFQI